MTARLRDPGMERGKLALTPQQISSAGSDVDGETLNLDSFDTPMAAKFVCMFNSGDNTDDIAFQVQESDDGGSSWSDVAEATATGLSGDNDEAEIDVRNVQDLEADIRVIMDSANSTLNSADAEIAVAVFFKGQKEI